MNYTIENKPFFGLYCNECVYLFSVSSIDDVIDTSIFCKEDVNEALKALKEFYDLKNKIPFDVYIMCNSNRDRLFLKFKRGSMILKTEDFINIARVVDGKPSF
jgi:hypothetical protein